jgi:outer membrane lipoprotein-sorting protein
MIIKITTILMFVIVYLLNGEDVNQILNDVKWRDDGDTRTADVELKIVSSDGNIRIREVKYLEKDLDKKRDTLLYVKTPRDVRGTTVLIKNDSTVDGDTKEYIWLYIPVLGKSKKLSNLNKSGRFVGSNFRYSDLGWMILEDYKYKLLGKEMLNGQEVYKVEALAKSNDVIDKDGYSRKVLWIDKKYNLIVKANYYNRQGFLLKNLTTQKIQNIDGYWTVLKQTIYNYIDNQKTVMSISNVKYNVKLPNNLFRKSKLGKSLDETY